MYRSAKFMSCTIFHMFVSAQVPSTSPQQVPFKAVFYFNIIVGKRTVLMFREHLGRTNDMDTREYSAFRYDTVEVKNGLYGRMNLHMTHRNSKSVGRKLTVLFFVSPRSLL